MSEEKVILQNDNDDLLITNKRFVIGSKTYALGQITSVNGIALNTGPRKLFGLDMKIYYALVLIAGVLVSIAMSFGVLILISFFLVYALSKYPRQTEYWVELSTSSGEEPVMCTLDNEEYCMKIVNALNEAIAIN
tara:strand:+ start:53 stop:457 length:405 start_codon:yes stop_codon:yes gene_type:complete